jgi:anaerobic selenocysteine-containing dehydrogenase
VLRRLAPAEAWAEINPSDARTLGIQPNDRIEIASRRAKIAVRAFVTRTVRRGEILLAMHDPTINRLTFAAFDPYSRQPAYKACAVRVVPASLT